MLFNILLAAVITYGLICGVVFLMQPRMVYYPQVERALTATPRAAGLDYEDVKLITDDGVELHGWWVPVAHARGAMVMFHGNAGNISHRIGYLTMFNRLGYASLIVDYRGYGQSSGHPGEEGTYRDAEAAWQYLTEARHVKASDVVIVGESLGGAVATWLAVKHPPRALVLASTFTSVPNLGATIYWWLPVRLLARIHYDNLERIAQISAPVLIAHSPDDDIIPFSHAEALYGAAHEPKQFMKLSGGHNSGLLYGREEWIATVRDFLEKR